MKDNPRIIRPTLSLLIATGLPVVSALMINLMGMLLSIKSADAQEWPAPKDKGSACLEIQGEFRNHAEDTPSNSLALRSPPWLSSGVLRSGWPGRNLIQVKIETLDNTILRFWFIDQSGEISEPQEFKSTCQNGWWTFNITVSARTDIETTFVQLAIAADGSLLAHVVSEWKGKDFYLFPRKSSEEFEYRFLKMR